MAPRKYGIWRKFVDPNSRVCEDVMANVPVVINPVCAEPDIKKAVLAGSSWETLINQKDEADLCESGDDGEEEVHTQAGQTDF